MRWKLLPNWSLCWGANGPSSWCLCLWLGSAVWRAIPGWSWAEAGHTSKEPQDLAFWSAWHRERNHHLCHIVLAGGSHKLVVANPGEAFSVRWKWLQVPHESQWPRLQSKSGCQTLTLPQSKALAKQSATEEVRSGEAAGCEAHGRCLWLRPAPDESVTGLQRLHVSPPAPPASVCSPSHLSLHWIVPSYLVCAGGVERGLHMVCGSRRETLPLMAFSFHFLTPPSPPPSPPPPPPPLR